MDHIISLPEVMAVESNGNQSKVTYHTLTFTLPDRAYVSPPRRKTDALTLVCALYNRKRHQQDRRQWLLFASTLSSLASRYGQYHRPPPPAARHSLLPAVAF